MLTLHQEALFNRLSKIYAHELAANVTRMPVLEELMVLMSIYSGDVMNGYLEELRSAINSEDMYHYFYISILAYLKLNIRLDKAEYPDSTKRLLELLKEVPDVRQTEP